MFRPVLWTLDNETDSQTFERLCVDILYRTGYRTIVPVGGMHDRGRDAELGKIFRAADKADRVVIFQFSRQKQWRQKLRVELRKTKDQGHVIDTYVFVTTQEVSGRVRDQLAVEVEGKFGWRLEILSREWLRLQLEEAHPDLAERHLGVPLAPRSHLFVGLSDFPNPGGQLKSAWTCLVRDDFERGTIELRAYLSRHQKASQAWEMLAWCLYQTYRYNEAIAAINTALEISPDSSRMKSIRACILAESGIERGDRRSILEANEVFSTLLQDGDEAHRHYNYANTLSALARHEEAVLHYRRAAEIEPRDARIWKNLATAYHETGRHNDEMASFDRAIELEPDMPEALISKGVSLMLDFNQLREAATLIERGLTSKRDLTVRWPHAWYWLGEAYRRLGELDAALSWVRKGLRHVPGNTYLRRLELKLVAALWRRKAQYRSEALAYFLKVVAEEPLHYAARAEAASVLEKLNRLPEAWDVIEDAFPALDLATQSPLRALGFTLDDCRKALVHLPAYSTFRRRYPTKDYGQSSKAPAVNRAFDDILTVGGAVTFGLAINAVNKALKVRHREKRERDLEAVFVQLREQIKRYVSKAAGQLAAGLTRGHGSAVVAGKVTTILMFGPVVVSEEWMRQYGWLLGTYSFATQVQGRIIGNFVDVATGSLFKEMVEPTLIEVNKVAQLFPEKKAEIASLP